MVVVSGKHEQFVLEVGAFEVTQYIGRRKRFGNRTEGRLQPRFIGFALGLLGLVDTLGQLADGGFRPRQQQIGHFGRDVGHGRTARSGVGMGAVIQRDAWLTEAVSSARSEEQTSELQSLMRITYAV